MTKGNFDPSLQVGEYQIPSSIRTVGSFLEIKLDNLPSESLVIFDVDETLITPADILLKPAGRSFSGWEKIKPEQLENYLSIMLASTSYVLVDEEIPIIIQRLSQKKISAMGLTACSTGSIGVIQSMEKWRFDQLKAVGIDFSSFFTEEYVFSELVSATSSPPLFMNGILFTGDFQAADNSTKGQLFGIFLDRINWKPEQIVFIDDDMKHLEAMLKELDQRGIPFQGYLLKKPSPELDKEIAQFQIQTLLHSNKWISDNEAKKRG